MSPHCTIGGGTKSKDMTEEDLKIGRETANAGKLYLNSAKSR